MNDYTNARWYAISGLGYGKGHTAEEAFANYISAQLTGHRAENTIYETRKAFEEALRSGDLKPDVWETPEGTVGFIIDHTGLQWEDAEGTYRHANREQLRYPAKKETTSQ